jgi:exoribonuclease II
METVRENQRAKGKAKGLVKEKAKENTNGTWAIANMQTHRLRRKMAYVTIGREATGTVSTGLIVITGMMAQKGEASANQTLLS